jgi:hypothetical protein
VADHGNSADYDCKPPVARRKVLGDFDCEEGLADIEKKSGDAEAFGSTAGYVRGTDVAAAGGADVLLAEGFYEQIAEGDRPKKVRERNGEEPGVHCRPNESTKCGGEWSYGLSPRDYGATTEAATGAWHG